MSDATASTTKWLSVALVAFCAVLVMTLWFATTAALPALRLEFALTDRQASLMSSSVSVGFVTGTFISAILGLADRFEPRRFFAISALVAALANILVLAVGPTSDLVPGLRFVVGACMAGVYPVGVKMVSAWAERDMGLLVGLLVGALTLGTAAPHLIDALGGLDWRVTLVTASVLAALGGLLVNLASLGPRLVRASAFETRFLMRAWTNKAVRLANLGYFGHMWELYAMWAWVGVFLNASFALDPGGEEAPLYARLVAFSAIGIGALGCLFGGLVADRMGRTTLTMGAMAMSGTCALLIGFLFGGDPWLLSALCLFWGVTIVADSAQFSSSIIELSEPGLVGTMVTVQICLGFLLTTVTIHMIPLLVELVGWSYAFASVAIGPYLGVFAMARLRAHPDARKLAGGNR